MGSGTDVAFHAVPPEQVLVALARGRIGLTQAEARARLVHFRLQHGLLPSELSVLKQAAAASRTRQQLERPDAAGPRR